MKQKLRKKVRERDGHECQFCESEENLHTHHIVPKKAGGSDSKENLITVCASCHNTIENTQGNALKRIKKEKEEKIEEIEQEKEKLKEEKEELRQKLGNAFTFDELLEATDEMTARVPIDIIYRYGIGKGLEPTFVTVTSDSERAIEAYEEEGSVMRKESVSSNVSVGLKENRKYIKQKINRIQKYD